MTVTQGIFLFSAAVAGGALNSVAGGGSFIAFPALLFTGMPPVNANATNTAAMWPGQAASVVAYRDEIRDHRRLLVPLMLTGICGGLTGAIVLLHTPQATFMKLIPWLLLIATLLLAFSRQVTRWITHHTHRRLSSRKVVLLTALAQLAVGLYIGYFGAGAGMLMMAMFAILGVQSIHAINGLKTALATITNGMALITFVLARAIWWPQASLMVIGGALGGYWGAWLAQRMNPLAVRVFAICTGFAMTAYFFVKTLA